jgi:hypothetical protein
MRAKSYVKIVPIFIAIAFEMLTIKANTISEVKSIGALSLIGFVEAAHHEIPLGQLQTKHP